MEQVKELLTRGIDRYEKRTNRVLLETNVGNVNQQMLKRLERVIITRAHLQQKEYTYTLSSRVSASIAKDRYSVSAA